MIVLPCLRLVWWWVSSDSRHLYSLLLSQPLPTTLSTVSGGRRKSEDKDPPWGSAICCFLQLITKILHHQTKITKSTVKFIARCSQGCLRVIQNKPSSINIVKMNLNINKKYKIDWITHKICLHNENDTLVNELAMESIDC